MTKQTIMPEKPQPSLRLAVQTIKKAYLPDAFGKRQLTAVIMGVCFGGIAGAIFASGDQGRQPGWAVAAGAIAGAVIGASLLLAAVPRKQKITAR